MRFLPKAKGCSSRRESVPRRFALAFTPMYRARCNRAGRIPVQQAAAVIRCQFCSQPPEHQTVAFVKELIELFCKQPHSPPLQLRKIDPTRSALITPGERVCIEQALSPFLSPYSRRGRKKTVNQQRRPCSKDMQSSQSPGQDLGAYGRKRDEEERPSKSDCSIRRWPHPAIHMFAWLKSHFFCFLLLSW